MFPSSDGAAEEAATDGVVSYVPYSDGFCGYGALPRDAEERARSRRVGFESLSAVIGNLAQPVTCVVCTMVVPSVLDVASELGIPLAVYWIQPAHVLAAYYHHFHGYGDLIASHAATDPAHEVSLPGLSRPLRIRGFPPFLVDTTGSALTRTLNEAMRELFQYMERCRPKLLVNTFHELEPAALITTTEMERRHLDVFPVGPMVTTTGSSTSARLHLFKHDDGDRKRCMGWLDAQPEKSVVYASFGSISKHKKQQMEEIVQGLKLCGRPYLLVVRKDGLDEEDTILETTATTTQGMVVEWCDQLEVLSHAAVGCFVSHCGWNSTLEAVLCGVPVVAVPNTFDQPTKVKHNDEGVVTAAELARCGELVMGEDDANSKASLVRERTEALKRSAQEAAVPGGHADRNLLDFIKTI